MNTRDLPSNASEISFEEAINNKIPDSTTHRISAFLGFNLGNSSLITQMPLGEFYQFSSVANDRSRMSDNEIAQRNLDISHARKLGLYIFKSLVQVVINDLKKTNKEIPTEYTDILEDLGGQLYSALQPIVVNIRTQDNKIPKFNYNKSADGKCWNIDLNQSHRFWVIDGQHRRKGIELMFNDLEYIIQNGTYPAKGLYIPRFVTDKKAPLNDNSMNLFKKVYEIAFNSATIAIEVHLGLSVEQERQLFHDLNRLGKKMDTNLALNYDTSNPINKFTTEFLVEKIHLMISDSEIKDWNADKGEFLRKDIASINARLFLNKTNINGATQSDVTSAEEIAKRFWTAVSNIPGLGKPQSKKLTVAAQPVVLKALAKLAYDFGISKRKPEKSEEYLDILINGINQTGNRKIDFSHSNPMWRYYTMSDNERQRSGIIGLKDYLPDDNDGANRDIGSYQDPYFRFGSKHNDIFPLIAAMIRWELGLPSTK